MGCQQCCDLEIVGCFWKGKFLQVSESGNCSSGCLSLPYFSTFPHKQYDFAWSTRYSCQILMKPEISLEICRKYAEFHKNISSGSRVVLCRRADGRDESNSYFRGRIKWLTKACDWSMVVATVVYICCSSRWQNNRTLLAARCERTMDMVSVVC